mmetsp:Transcript_21913/g.48443  ORF Transcript_21913/g.48443 Transcript_21913/m.48443 type:complete len:90 (-) Transcript_21913:79-348(-)
MPATSLHDSEKAKALCWVDPQELAQGRAVAAVVVVVAVAEEQWLGAHSKTGLLSESQGTVVPLCSSRQLGWRSPPAEREAQLKAAGAWA